MTFMCTTGTSGPILLSENALNCLHSKGLISENERGEPVVKIHKDSNQTFTAVVQQSLSDANVLGLAALSQLGLNTSEDGFSFNPAFRYL